jgi:hypothetical protein
MTARLADACGVPKTAIRRNLKHDSDAYSDVWVTFPDTLLANECIQRMDGRMFGGREIRCSLARFQGKGPKEKQVERSKVASLAYGVGGVYRDEDLKVHVTSNEFIPDLYASFFAMCSAQQPPIALVKFILKDKRKTSPTDDGKFDGYGFFENPMERDRAVATLDNQRDGDGKLVVVSRFMSREERMALRKGGQQQGGPQQPPPQQQEA